MADKRTDSLLLLCHSGGWDRLYQAASAAATAASMGRPVDLVFYFGALQKLLEGRLDEITLEPPQPEVERRLQEGVDEIGSRPVSELLREAREGGEVRLLACSASTRLLGQDLVATAELVDEVVGWPTVMRLMGVARHVLYL